MDWKDPEQVREYKRAYQSTYYQNNKEKAREYYQNNKETAYEYYQNNKERLRKYKREYNQNNREKIRETKREYDRNNKEMYRESSRKWAKNNPASVNQRSAKRRALKIHAIPEWIKNCLIEKKRISNLFKLAQIYEKMDEVKRNVDHMWPLSDGGPHWSGNLQVLTKKENLEKGAYSCPKIKKQIKINLKEARILHGTTA